MLNAAVKEVKNCCSEDTFDTFMTYVLNNKTKEYEDARRELDKKNSQIEELSALIIMYLGLTQQTEGHQLPHPRTHRSACSRRRA